jgi:hypothetical protein
MTRFQDPIKQTVDLLLDVDCKVVTKSKKSLQQKDIFVKLINEIEGAIIRSNIAFTDLGLDLGSYEDSFFNIIDSLLIMRFGPEGAEVVSQYLWDRTSGDDVDGFEIKDNSGTSIILNDAKDLWAYLASINPKLLDDEEG